MNNLFLLFLFLSSHLFSLSFKNGQQMLLVIAKDWHDTNAILRTYEKKQEQWHLIGKPIKVSLGRTGLAWSHGLHGKTIATGPQKKEGDGKSPAGIYPITAIFGLNALNETGPYKMPYLHFSKSMQGVDDPSSQYYNQIVDTEKIEKTWNSAEMLGSIPAYEYGAVIGFNENPTCSDSGSCVYIHLWEDRSIPTAGCTAMSKENLLKVLKWMNSKQNPLIVQLTEQEYKIRFKDWDLPRLNL